MSEKTFEKNQDVPKIKQFPITEYAAIIGYTVQRIGNYYTLKEHQSVRIDPYKNCFWRNSNGASGSIIDFSIEFENKDKDTAINDLAILVNGEKNYQSIMPLPVKPIKESKEFELPLPDNNMKNVFAYLINTRKIDKDIVREMVHEKRLYQDIRKNCVFVSYNDKGKADFASFRGTNTEKRFLGDVENSNYDMCWHKENGSNSLVVTESVIDALSYMTLIKENGGDYRAFNYQALSSSQKASATLNMVEVNKDIDTVIIALDNDNSGLTATYDLQNNLREKGFSGNIREHIPKENDWNSQLITFKSLKNEKSKVSKISPKENDYER